jgi:predicted GNAT superfamily acetyltransferase
MWDRTEHCGTPACISVGVEISPSEDALNFLYKRKRADKFNYVDQEV